MKIYGLEMIGPIRSRDGVKSIEIDAGTGKVHFKKDVQFDGTVTLSKDVKITKNSPSNGKVIFTTDSNGTLDWSYKSVPSGEIILFEKDTAVTGYTLLYDVDDEIVYITKGSAHGGNEGGTSTGDWDQGTHDHDAPTSYTDYHTLTLSEIPSHRHAGHNGDDFLSSTGSTHSKGGNKWTSFTETASVGGDQPHRHDLSGFVADGTVSSWRPKGRHFTRQQKN